MLNEGVRTTPRRIFLDAKMSMWQGRISIDPAILVGKPAIQGTRLAVEFLLDLMAEGWTAGQILANYPQLTADDLRAALHYAESLKRERANSPSASAGRRPPA